MNTVYIEKNDLGATLTTWIYCAFHMCYRAESLGKTPYINWPSGMNPSRCLQAYEDAEMFAKIPNMFEWYFKQPFTSETTKRDEVWTWETPAYGMDVDTTVFQLMSEPLSVIRDYYQKHLQFNEETNRRGQLIADKYNIDFSKTIGLTWRGTDVYLDGRPNVPIEAYYPFIDDILSKEPDLRIACTAEEDTILDPLLVRYPSAFKIEEFLSSPFGSKHNPERLTQVSGYLRGLQPALMVWLFSKCAHYIKNRSSTGAVASWLSNGNIISLFHPENLGFPANTSTVEINGKQYTPDNKLIG